MSCYRKWIVTIVFSFLGLFVIAQDSTRVYPTHWFTGMKNRNLQLIFYNKNKNLRADNWVVQSANAAIKIKRFYKNANRHYLIVDVEIAPNARPGKYLIKFGGLIRSEWSNIWFEL